jgi:hypothetical protein
MGFYKSPPPPQPLAKRKKQEPKFRDLLRKQNSNLLSPNQKPTKSTWKAPKTVAYFNTGDMKRSMIELQHVWVQQRGWRRTGPLEPPNHAKQPSLTHSTFPSLFPYLPTSLSPSHGWPSSSPHMVLLLKLKATKGFVALPQELGHFFQLWPT